MAAVTSQRTLPWRGDVLSKGPKLVSQEPQQRDWVLPISSQEVSFPLSFLCVKYIKLTRFLKRASPSLVKVLLPSVEMTRSLQGYCCLLFHRPEALVPGHCLRWQSVFAAGCKVLFESSWFISHPYCVFLYGQILF